MICGECLHDGTENEALGKKFWYCRNCKKEIQEDWGVFLEEEFNKVEPFITLPSLPPITPLVPYCDCDNCKQYRKLNP